MSLLIELGLIAVSAVGVAVSVALLPSRSRTRWKRAAPPQAPHPEQLVRLERLVGGSTTSALHVHAYLRPLLREIVSRRLAVHARSLDRLPVPAGRELLGDPLWEIVRPDRPFPEDRHGPGVSASELSAMLDVLERL